MAIPYGLPSDELTLEQYRTIHQLLVDLTALLRTVLARYPAWVNNHADVAVTTNANYPNINSIASTLDASNSNSESASTIGFYPLGSPFRLPLSPPNSEPGSHCVSTTATSNFRLPDVVCSAARTLNALKLQRMQPVSCDFNANAAVVAHTYSNGNSESHVIPTDRSLRKRKRVKLSNKKILQNKNHGLSNSQIYEEQQQQQQRPKVAKSNYKSTTCATFLMANAAAVGQQQRQPQEAERRSKMVDERGKLACSTSSCKDSIHDNAIRRTLANECFCNCKQQLTSQPDYKIPVCMQVGEELRKISDCCKNWRKVNGRNSCVKILRGEFGRTVFATALLIIGWALLKQM